MEQDLAPDGELSQAAVFGKTIVGTSPIVLPDCCCVKCGQDPKGGRRVRRTLYARSWRWRWLLVIPYLFIPYLLVHFGTGKPVDVAYSVCPDCLAADRTRMRLAWGLWLVVIATVVVTIVAEVGWLWVVTLVVALAALVASSGYSLWVVGYQGELFYVRGAGKEFLAAVTRPDD